MKTCTKCNQSKELSRFYKQTGGKSNKESSCKECKKTYYHTNKDKIDKDRKRANQKAWQESNKEQQKVKNKAWKEANKERVRANNKAWTISNLDKKSAHTAKYRAAKLQRTPSWLTPEDWTKINHMYSLAAFMTKQTGIKHEVDHIVPLQGETISGLHHPDNLQILTKSENCSKGNK